MINRPPFPRRLRRARLAAGRQFQQRLGRFAGQMVGQRSGVPSVGRHARPPATRRHASPSRHPKPWQQRFQIQRRFRLLDISRNPNLLHRLADLHKLCRAVFGCASSLRRAASRKPVVVTRKALSCPSFVLIRRMSAPTRTDQKFLSLDF
jgi:hypothetical protein